MENLDVIIVNDELTRISPNALRLLNYLLNYRSETYSTSSIRQSLGFDEKRNLRPYFKELQDLGLISFEPSQGAVQVTLLCRVRLIEAWGLRVLDTDKPSEGDFL
ncbi:TPA: hypothetical protein KKL69_004548 [Escherichia coli]|nr:hypothetical protein [Escherichia coli]